MTGTQAGMFDVQAKRKVQKGDVVFSLSFDERKIIQAIIDLYNNGEPFDVDPTYSTGRFWTGLPKPLQKFDMFPQTPDTQQANSNCLPLENESINSIMFDPPFVIKNIERANGKRGKIEQRFYGYPTIGLLREHYRTSLQEFFRILKPAGIIAFKCQDTISSSINYCIHAEIIQMALAIGFTFADLFVLGNRNVMLDPRVKNQRHARKNHSYYLVFRKPKK